MTTTSHLQSELDAAYRATDYRVYHGSSVIVLRIDSYNSEMAALLEESDCQSACYVTACNPMGELKSDTINRSACAALEKALTQSGYRWIRGLGINPDGGWPGEESYLVLGMPLSEARPFCRQWRQNACLWIGPEAIPRLVYQVEVQQ